MYSCLFFNTNRVRLNLLTLAVKVQINLTFARLLAAFTTLGK